MGKKKFSPFDECLCFVCVRTQNKQKHSLCLSVWLSGCVRTWTLAVDTTQWARGYELSSGHEKHVLRESMSIQSMAFGCLMS